MNLRIILNKWIKELARDEDTKRAYKRAVDFFISVNKLSDDFSTERLTMDHFEKYLVWLQKNYSVATQAQYSIGTSRFLAYLFRHSLCSVNPEQIRAAKAELTIQQKASIPQFPREDIETLLEASDWIIEQAFQDENAKLRAYRDQAILLTLADTGLRVSEACGLKRGQIDTNEGQAIVKGKGRKEAVVRFSPRSLRAIRAYLDARAELDGKSGKPLKSLPVFAAHSKSSSDKVNTLATKTVRDIINQWVTRILGVNKLGTITPHSFRHYFVTMALLVTGNLKVAQGLARHESITVTERYGHLTDKDLDKAYHEIFGKPQMYLENK